MFKKLAIWLRKAWRFIQHDLWSLEQSHESRLHAFGVEALRVGVLIVRGAKEDRCGLHAAALTYATLVALVPFLVILFSIGKALGFDKAEQWLLNASKDMPEQIQFFVQRVLEIVGGINPAALGAVGGIIFLIVIYKLLNSVEESFNQIWRVASSRSIADKTRNYLSVLIITPALALIANAGSAAIMTFAARSEWAGWVVGILMQLAPLLLSSLAFVSLFMFLPNTRVRFRAAFIGGLFSAAAIILLQFIVLKFSGKMFHKYAIYGSFAFIFIFFFWVQLNWTILLYGSELAFAIQNRRTYAEERAASRASMSARIQTALLVMQDILRAFCQDSGAWDAGSFAARHQIPLRLLLEILEVLVSGGLIAEVETEEGHFYALLHSPEQITPRKICTLLLDDGVPPEKLNIPSAPFSLDVALSEQPLFSVAEVKKG